MTNKADVPGLDLEGFEQFFETKLRPILLTLEDDRFKQNQRTQFIVVLDVILVVVGIILFMSDISGLGVLCFLIAGGLTWLVVQDPEEWNKTYKEKVMTRLVKFVDPNINYSPDGGIIESVFNSTELYRTYYSDYYTEDLIYGKLRNINFQFCEIRVVNRDKNETVLFDGVMMECDFNKRFEGHYILRRDLADSVPLGKFLSKFDKFDRIQLEDPRFERIFDLRGTDQVEGRYIFSTSFMERVLKLEIFLQREFQMAFVNGKMYISFPEVRDQYDHDHMLKADHYMHLFESYRFTCEMLAIISILDLNNDIWKNS